MRRFNVDEFIKFIILIVLIMFLGYLVLSGEINKILSDKIVIWTKIAIMLLLLISCAQFGKIKSFNYRVDNSFKYLPVIITLSLGIVFIYNNSKDSSNIIRENNDFSQMKVDENIIDITNDNYEILKEFENNPKKYEGKKFIIKGFVDIPSDENGMFTLAREEIQCCASDACTLGVRAKCSDYLEKNKWIEVLGEFKYEDKYYLEVIRYNEISKPDNPYFRRG